MTAPQLPLALLAPDAWQLVRTFFEADRCYRERCYNPYHQRVLTLAHDRGVDRHALRLEPRELVQLIDLAVLDELRLGPVGWLHEMAPLVLTDHHRASQRFIRLCSQVFHEVSVLHELQFMISTIAGEEPDDLEEYESIITDAHRDFPRKIRRIHLLFGKARKSLFEILPQLRNAAEDAGRIFIRSLYLFGEEMLRDGDAVQLDDIYWRLYREGGPVEGYLEVALSFKESNFAAQSREALRRAIEKGKELQARPQLDAAARDAAASHTADAEALLATLPDQGSEPAAAPSPPRDEPAPPRRVLSARRR